MGWLSKRFGEASTHAGLGVIAAAITAYLQGGNAAIVPAIITGVLGALGVCIPEGKTKQD